ncbi:MAG: hypothetical protein K6B73_05160 [Treponema sp.]|nr:hypothetical protein [Treponema sp.]
MIKNMSSVWGGVPLKTVLFSACLLLLVSCDNFLNGELQKKELEEMLAYNESEYAEVEISANASAVKTLVPAANLYDKTYKETDKIALKFEPQSGYKFMYWRATPESSVGFDDTSAFETTATIKKHQKQKIIIEPYCVERPFPTVSPDSTGGLKPKNTSIVINFNKPLSMEGEPSAENYPQSELYAALNKIKIVNGAGVNVRDHYEEPLINSDKTSITFNAKDSNPFELTGGSMEIKVTVPKEFYYLSGITKVEMSEDKSFSFEINNTTKNFVTVRVPNNPENGNCDVSGEFQLYEYESKIINFTLNEHCSFDNWTFKNSDGTVLTKNGNFIFEGESKILEVIAPDDKTVEELLKNRKVQLTLKSVTGVSARVITVLPAGSLHPFVTDVSPQYALGGTLCDTPVTINFSEPVHIDSFRFTDSEIPVNCPEEKVLRDKENRIYGYYDGNNLILKNILIQNEKTFENLNKFYSVPTLSDDGRTLVLEISDYLLDKNSIDILELGLYINCIFTETESGIVYEAGSIKSTSDVDCIDTFIYKYRLNSTRRTDLLAPVIVSSTLTAKFDDKVLSQDLTPDNMTDELITANHVSRKLHLDLTATDTISGVKEVRVTETQITEFIVSGSHYAAVDSSSVVCNKRLVSDVVAKDGSTYILDADYECLSSDGLVQLDFYVLDNENNASVFTYYVIMDTGFIGQSLFIFNETEPVRRICFNQKSLLNDINDRKDHWYKIGTKDFSTDESSLEWKIQWGSSEGSYDEGVTISSSDISANPSVYSAGLVKDFSLAGGPTSVTGFYNYILPDTPDLYIKVTLQDDVGNILEKYCYIPGAAEIEFMKKEITSGSNDSIIIWYMPVFKSLSNPDYVPYLTVYPADSDIAVLDNIEISDSDRGWPYNASSSTTYPLDSRFCAYLYHQYENHESKNNSDIYTLLDTNSCKKDFTLQIFTETEKCNVVEDWSYEQINEINAASYTVTITFNDTAESVAPLLISNKKSPSDNYYLIKKEMLQNQKTYSFTLPYSITSGIVDSDQKIYIQEAEYVQSACLIQDTDGTFTDHLQFVYQTANDTVPPILSSTIQTNYYLNKNKIELGHLDIETIKDDSGSVTGYFRMYYDTSENPSVLKSEEEILQLDYEEFIFSDWYNSSNQLSEGVKAVVVPKSFLYDNNASVAYLVLYDGKGNYKVYGDKPYTSFFDIYDIPADFAVDYANNKVTVKSYCFSYGYLYVDPVMASASTPYNTHKYKWDTDPGNNGAKLPVTKVINNSSSPTFTATLKDHFLKMYLDEDARGFNRRMHYAGPVYYWCGSKNVCTLKEVLKATDSKILVKSDNAVFMHTYYSNTDFGEDLSKWSLYGYEANLVENKVTAANVGVPSGYEYSPSYTYVTYKHKTSFIHWADGTTACYKWY